MKTKLYGNVRLIGAGLVLIAAFSAFLFQQNHTAQANPPEAAGAAPPPMPVKVAVIEKNPLRIWTSYSGRMEAVDYVELRPEVSGRIDEIKFEDGQIINKGDVLFVIDPRPYEASVKEAEAAVNSAKNQQSLALKELNRAEELVKSGAVSKRVLDERDNTAVISKNSIEAAKAQLAKAQIDLDHAYIKSPITGRISRAEITVGNVVEAGPGAPVLTTIVSTEGIYADFEVDEQGYFSNIHQQAANREDESKIPVKLTLNGNAKNVYEGYIKSFDNRINSSSGTIRARAYFDNADASLIPGMYASVSMGSPSTEEAILLTDQAISTDQDRKFVYVVGNDNKVAYREIKLGASVDGQHVITEGLKPGEKVIIDGIMKIRPDMLVAPEVVKTAKVEAPPEAVVKTQPAKAAAKPILEEAAEPATIAEPEAATSEKTKTP